MLEVANHIDQGNKYRNLNQWPHRRRKCFLAPGAIYRDDNSDRKLKIVRSRRKRLRAADFVAESCPPHHPSREREYDEEVYNQWCTDSKNGSDLLDDVCALAGKEDDDRVEQADQ